MLSRSQSRQFSLEAKVGMNFKKRLILVGLIVLIMFTLHNSFWLWHLDDKISMLFGFMPFAFSYYVFYAFLSVVAIKLVINLAWPDPPREVLESIEIEREQDQP